MNTIFSHPWPEDLPCRCPRCSGEFTTVTNLKIGPGRAGRLFRAFAYWGMAGWSVLGWVLLVLAMYMDWNFDGVGIGGFGLVVYFLLPALIFMPIAILMPLSRHVRCFKCGFSRDFRSLPKRA